MGKRKKLFPNGENPNTIQGGDALVGIRNNDQTQEIQAQLSSSIVRLEQCLGALHKPKKIYYPCCGSHIDPLFAFPNTEIIFSDINKGFEVEITTKGGRFICEDVKLDCLSEDFDTLLIFNPMLTPKLAIAKLQVGGFIICNNHHGTADVLQNDNNYKLIRQVKKNGQMIDNPIKRAIDSDQERIENGIDRAKANYIIAKKLIEFLINDGKAELIGINSIRSVLDNYKKVRYFAREIEHELVVSTGGGEKVGIDEEAEYSLMFDGWDNMIPLPALPSSFGSDDYYVFKKQVE